MSNFVGNFAERDLDPALSPQLAPQQAEPARESHVADEIGEPMLGGPMLSGLVSKGLGVETANITSRGALYEYVETIPPNGIAACIQRTKSNEYLVPECSSGLKRRGWKSLLAPCVLGPKGGKSAG